MLRRPKAKGTEGGTAASWVSLRELRERFGIRQSDIAAVLGTTQPAVLKTENASDPRVSSLRRYVEAVARLKGQRFDLRIVASIGDEDIVLRLPEAPTPESADTPPTRADRSKTLGSSAV